jgi:cell division protein ZapA (FtsZ GTPase activity inhibitor)
MWLLSRQLSYAESNMSKSNIDTGALEAIEVTIFNQTYRLRSKTSKEHVEQIARLVDERMRLISSQITTHDALKIAVLTALNIADEMQHLRNYYENEIQPLLSKVSDDQETVKEEKTKDESESNKSWFEDFFEAKVETKNREERLSSQVSSKLQSLRQSNPEQIGITTEENDA